MSVTAPQQPELSPADLRLEAGAAILEAIASLAESAQGAPTASDAREYATAVQALAQGFASINPSAPTVVPGSLSGKYANPPTGKGSSPHG